MKNKWRTFKHPRSGNTVVEVWKGNQIITLEITPQTRKKMTLKEFQRLIKRLQEAIEL